MECVVLGNGGMMPTPLRMTASVLVRREGRMLMFDAGEGIQISLKRTGFGICSLDAIVVSHLHADHVLGIPGILMYRAQCDAAGPLTIVGPPGIRRFVQHTIEDLGYYLNYEVRYVEWPGAATAAAASAAPGLAPSGESKSKAAANMQPLWSWNGHVVRAAPLTHSTFCLGFRLEEASRPGRFDVDRARALGVPVGPLCGRLQAGESVELSDGRVIQPTEVLGPERRGRVLAYATDSRPCVALEDLCRGADLAFVESMFAREHAADAEEKRHMTTVEAASCAARAGVARLVLLHLSPRYTRDDEARLEHEATSCFARAQLGRELAVYPVPLPD